MPVMTDDEWIESWMPRGAPAALGPIRRLTAKDFYWILAPNKTKIVPYAESVYILKHGKKAYRAAKAADHKFA